MESLQIIDKFCSSPLANFLNVAYIFMQVMRNAKQSFADVFQNRCSQKFHKKKISQENTYVETPTQMFSCEICKIFNNTFFYRTPPVAAFGNGRTFYLLSIFLLP